MPSPYHVDLRESVITAVQKGMKKTKACDVFNVCRQTIYSWLKLEKEQGHLEPKKDYQKGHSHSISDLNAFKQYVKTHADHTQEEIADHFSIGSSSVGRALQKIALTRKKRITRTQSKMKKKGVNLKKKSKH